MSRSLELIYENARQPAGSVSSAEDLMRGFPATDERRVTWHNWMRAPFNQWGFRHLARLRPSISVRAGQGSASAFTQAPQNLDGLFLDSECGQRVSVAEHLNASHTDAFIVVKGNAIVFERYFNGQCDHDRHIMFSVTKSLIGILGEQLVSEGRLLPDALASVYVPELSGSAFADATVQQLFDMAVGIEYSEIYDDPDSESSQYGYACGFQPTPAQYARYQTLYEYLPSLKKRGEHGGFFHYVTATTEVLAWVMERACGESCAQRLEAVWRELGCERDGYFTADPWGRNVAGAGFSATLRDMARFGRLVAGDGSVNGVQLLPASVFERIRAGGDASIYAADEEFSNWTPGASYRSQWYVFNDHSQAVMAGGIHGQYLFVDHASQVVIVKQSSLPQAVSELDADSVRMMRVIAAHLAG